MFKRYFSSTISGYNKPRRACLYVPGDSEKKLEKSLNLSVDCVILDCEDGVAISNKLKARNLIADFLPKTNDKAVEFAVRINALQSGFMEADLATILPKKPQTIFLPKVNSPSELKKFASVYKAIIPKNIVNLFVYAESATALLNLSDICRQGLEYQNLFKLCGIVFGSDDYCASIGVERSLESKEIFYARQYIITCAKAFSLQAIDMVHIDFHGTN